MDTIDHTEDRQHGLRYTAKRNLKLTYLLKSLHNWRGQILLYFSLLAIMFACVGLWQHKYVHRQVDQKIDQELALWATRVSAEIAYKDRWDLKGYRNADISVPSWYIVTKDGLIIDLAGDIISGIFGHVEVISGSIYGSPKTVVSSIGETWRLLGKKVDDGIVVVGIPSSQHIIEPDSLLYANIAKFGSTLKEAASIRSREIDMVVDYAVLSSAGKLVTAWGGVPLKIVANELPMIAGKKTTTIKNNSNSYRLYWEPILDINNQLVGTIIVPREITIEEQAMNLLDKFNIRLVIVSLVLTVVITFIFSARALLRRHNKLTIEDALRFGESKTVEFKSTFQWDTMLNQQNKDLRLATLKSIAGFLNSEGGTLFIGVNESGPSICGLKEDIKLAHGSIDKLQLNLHHLIADRLGPEFSPFITDRIEEAQNEFYWEIEVEPSPKKPAFVRWKAPGEAKELKHFYIREGPKTNDLDNEETYLYIKNKWG